jgi:hypothetical protein
MTMYIRNLRRRLSRLPIEIKVDLIKVDLLTFTISETVWMAEHALCLTWQEERRTRDSVAL